MLQGRRIHLCVCGGIAAYKAVVLCRELQKRGAEVRVAMSESAQHFVGPLTFQAITHARVLTRTLDAGEDLEIGHIDFAQACDALVVAPMTANMLGKAANGIGDEIVSTVLLAANVPVIAAPAMNTFMFENPAVQANLSTLEARGWHLVPPGEGDLACGHVGAGRLPEPALIADRVERALSAGGLAGRHVVVAAGPTREHLDPVRFLSNPSTGRTGFALAEAARDAGARVTLVTGPVALASPAGVEVVRVESAQEMHDAVHAAEAPDAVVMTAAVADWRPASVAATKQKKSGEAQTLSLVRTPDILASLGAARQGARPLLIGYAAETGDPVAAARGKLQRKGVDLIVANDVTQPGAGFASSTNQVVLVSAEGAEALPMQSKRAIAERLVSWLVERL